MKTSSTTTFITQMLNLLLIVVLITACKKDKDDPIIDPIIPPPPVAPVIDSVRITPDNKTVTVFFSQAVYGVSEAGKQAIDTNHLKVELSNGTAKLDSITIYHTSGAKTSTIELFTSGLINGEEVISVSARTNTSVVNDSSAYLSATNVATVNLKEIGIVGTWISTGANISEIYQYLNFDTIKMECRFDGTYTFETIKSPSIHNRLSGTYTQSKSDISGIWTITLNQNLPVVAESQGIFKAENELPVKMLYETVQVMPNIGSTPPTPESGFGSSTIFGYLNTITFLRLN